MKKDEFSTNDKGIERLLLEASQPKPTPERVESPEFFTGRQFAMGGLGQSLRGWFTATARMATKKPSSPLSQVTKAFES